jgi:S1-C subfamily serine protease
VPIHSFGDAQWALDRARKQETLAITWKREDKTLSGNLVAPAGWQKTDLSWRHSVRRLVPSPRLDGKDLAAEERKTLGLSATQLAYRLRTPLHPHAKSTGFQEGDIILGLENIPLQTGINGFYDHVALNHLVGDRIVVSVLRDGKRLNIPLSLVR